MGLADKMAGTLGLRQPLKAEKLSHKKSRLGLEAAVTWQGAAGARSARHSLLTCFEDAPDSSLHTGPL